MKKPLIQRRSLKKAGKEKLHFGLFLGLLFCSIITLKPLKVTPKYPRAFKNLSECGTMKYNKFQRTVTKYN